MKRALEPEESAALEEAEGETASDRGDASVFVSESALPLLSAIDIIEYVLPMCDGPTLASLACVCKLWQASANEAQHWRRLTCIKLSGSTKLPVPLSRFVFLASNDPRV